jgi:hypothetical protein
LPLSVKAPPPRPNLNPNKNRGIQRNIPARIANNNLAPSASSSTSPSVAFYPSSSSATDFSEDEIDSNQALLRACFDEDAELVIPVNHVDLQSLELLVVTAELRFHAIREAVLTIITEWVELEDTGHNTKQMESLRQLTYRSDGVTDTNIKVTDSELSERLEATGVNESDPDVDPLSSPNINNEARQSYIKKEKKDVTPKITSNQDNLDLQAIEKDSNGQELINIESSNNVNGIKAVRKSDMENAKV